MITIPINTPTCEHGQPATHVALGYSRPGQRVQALTRPYLVDVPGARNQLTYRANQRDATSTLPDMVVGWDWWHGNGCCHTFTPLPQN